MHVLFRLVVWQGSTSLLRALHVTVSAWRMRFQVFCCAEVVEKCCYIVFREALPLVFLTWLVTPVCFQNAVAVQQLEYCLCRPLRIEGAVILGQPA